MKINQGVLEEVYPSDIQTAYTSDGKILSILHIPNGVRQINAGVCKKLDITDVILPKSLQFIGIDSFKDCENLTNIVIPKKVEHIGSGAFAGCVKLKSAELPSNIETIYEDTFADCISLKEIKLPKNLKRIKKNGFLNCEQLENIDLPNGFLSIGSNAFSVSRNSLSISLFTSQLLKPYFLTISSRNAAASRTSCMTMFSELAMFITSSVNASEPILSRA